MRDIKDFQLLEYNTFGIEGKCKRFCEFDTVDELRFFLNSFNETDQPLMILGGGSNLLLTKDFPGTVLHSNIVTEPHIEIAGDNSKETDDSKDVFVTVGSGMIWDDFVDFCVKNHIYGCENLSLIPGTVGASAVQNIGAYGVEAKDIIYKVEVIEIATGEKHVFNNSECGFAYRYSRFKGEWKGQYVVTAVTYRLSTQFTPHLDYGNIREEIQRLNIKSPDASMLRQIIINIRQAKLPDPKIEGNAGSFFMNPVVDKAKYEANADDACVGIAYGNGLVTTENLKLDAGDYKVFVFKGRGLLNSINTLKSANLLKQYLKEGILHTENCTEMDAVVVNGKITPLENAIPEKALTPDALCSMRFVTEQTESGDLRVKFYMDKVPEGKRVRGMELKQNATPENGLKEIYHKTDLDKGELPSGEFYLGRDSNNKADGTLIKSHFRQELLLFRLEQIHSCTLP